MKYAHETLTLAGVAVVAYGAWLAWHPAGFLVGGLVLSVGSFLHGYKK